MVWGSKIVEPCFEAKPDWWVDVELAKRLGIDPAIVAPADQETDAAMLVAEAQVMLPDGSGWEPLAQVSAEDIEKYGLTCEPHDGRVPLEELHAKGGYQVPRSEGDALEWCALADFKADPEGCPVDTATGKLEVFSRALVERMDNYGTTPIDPIPTVHAGRAGLRGEPSATARPSRARARTPSRCSASTWRARPTRPCPTSRA